MQGVKPNEIQAIQRMNPSGPDVDNLVGMLMNSNRTISNAP